MITAKNIQKEFNIGPKVVWRCECQFCGINFPFIFPNEKFKKHYYDECLMNKKSVQEAFPNQSKVWQGQLNTCLCESCYERIEKNENRWKNSQKVSN